MSEQIKSTVTTKDEKEVAVIRGNEPMGNCRVNVEGFDGTIECRQIAYGTIHGMAVCDNHWVEAKKRLLE